MRFSPPQNATGLATDLFHNKSCKYFSYCMKNHALPEAFMTSQGGTSIKNEYHKKKSATFCKK
jgi:hypothetical protein